MRKYSASVSIIVCSYLLSAAMGIVWADTPVWRSVPESSELTFTAEYDGAPFTGRFESFVVEFCFDPEDLDSANLHVNVDVDSVDTENRERDETLAMGEWFAFGKFPSAQYEATQFVALGDNRYSAEGKLTLKGITQPLALSYEWIVEGDQVRVAGTARMIGDTVIDRTDHQIGAGEWADPDLIAHEVEVAFDVLLESSSKSSSASNTE